MQGRGFHSSTRGATEIKFCDAQPVDFAGLQNRRKTYPLCDRAGRRLDAPAGVRRGWAPRRLAWSQGVLIRGSLIRPSSAYNFNYEVRELRNYYTRHN